MSRKVPRVSEPRIGHGRSVCSAAIRISYEDRLSGLARGQHGLGSGLDEPGHLTGWETIATWLDGISTVVAPIRAANCRSASGGSAWSLA